MVSYPVDRLFSRIVKKHLKGRKCGGCFMTEREASQGGIITIKPLVTGSI